MTDKDKIKQLSEKADEIYVKTTKELGRIRGEQKKVISSLIEKTDSRKINKVKQEIEGL